MSVHFATSPQNGEVLVLGGLTRLVARGANAPLAMRNIDLRSVQIRPPQAVFDLLADEIAQGGGLETARRGATRYLVNAPSGPLAAAEVRVDADTKATLLVNINSGPFVASSARALDQIALLEVVKNGSYEARLLRFSAIAVVAIWLKPDSGTGDIIYPLAPAPAFLQAEKTYSASEFLALIRPAAQAIIAAKGTTTVP